MEQPHKDIDPTVRYIELLFNSQPDDEMLARMWEVDPQTMSRLMSEIGQETAEQIETEVPKWQSHVTFALNSLRIALGREPRWTPRQRMREAQWQYAAENTPQQP